MKTRTLLLTVGILGMITIYAFAADPVQNQNQGAQPGAVVGELTELEVGNILHMREEEKLARDVYLTLAELWDCPVFPNIAASEQRHMGAVGLLIAKYGLDDPIVDDAIGEFTDPVFAGLYTTLTEKGAGSLLEALSVGVEIEELDIQDLADALEETQAADVAWVFANLQRGSYNHLRAFTRNIASGGTSCSLQGAGNGFGAGKGSNGSACQGRGRAARGNGNGQGRGNGSRSRGCGGNGDGTCNLSGPQNGQAQPGVGQPAQQRKRDGSGQGDRRQSQDASCIAEENV